MSFPSQKPVRVLLLAAAIVMVNGQPIAAAAERHGHTFRVREMCVDHLEWKAAANTRHGPRDPKKKEQAVEGAPAWRVKPPWRGNLDAVIQPPRGNPPGQLVHPSAIVDQRHGGEHLHLGGSGHVDQAGADEDSEFGLRRAG